MKISVVGSGLCLQDGRGHQIYYREAEAGEPGEPSPATKHILAITSDTAIWSVLKLGEKHRRETDKDKGPINPVPSKPRSIKWTGMQLTEERQKT